MANDEVVVVGGGIGGLATALALARTGRRVRVLERAREFAELGAGLQLAPNATRLLRDWGLLDDLLAVGHQPRRLVLADALTGEELAWLDLTGQFVDRYQAPYVVAHRSDLLDLLLGGCQAAGVALEPDREVVGVDLDHTGATVRCAGGQQYRTSLVVAADGLRSRLRPLVHDDQPICSGYVAYRGAVPIGQASRRADLADVIAFIGPGIHFVQYALRGGALYNQVAVFRSERYRQGDPDWGDPSELRAAFAPACDHIHEAMAALWQDQRWAMYDREPHDGWLAGGRLALLGDAAHPMLQYLAQGACQALEDADALARAVSKLPAPLTEDSPVAEALAAYQRERAPRAALVQRNARTWGEIWHLDGVAAAVRNHALRRYGPTDFTATDWLYGASPEQREAPIR